MIIWNLNDEFVDMILLNNHIYSIRLLLMFVLQYNFFTLNLRNNLVFQFFFFEFEKKIKLTASLLKKEVILPSFINNLCLFHFILTTVILAFIEF